MFPSAFVMFRDLRNGLIWRVPGTAAGRFAPHPPVPLNQKREFTVKKTL
jgi:hypothetical protein